MIYNDIKNFPKQFEYEPKIKNSAASSRRAGRLGLVVAGMGGSHLAADIIQCWRPEWDILVWSNYGLPPLQKEELKNRLVIASSYSGNTEETLDSFKTAHALGLNCVALGSGGKLIETAKKNGVPYVELPRQNIQPRMALGWSFKALLAIMQKEKELAETARLSKTLKPDAQENAGKELAKKLRGTSPVIYASARNEAIAKIWKIKFNETGKIPAFWNVLPELNHNEMTGFDVGPAARSVRKMFHCILLTDADDDPRIKKRMVVLRSLYEKKGIEVETAPIEGLSRIHKIFSSIILADWVSYYTAKLYNAEPEQVPMVEEFKRRILDP